MITPPLSPRVVIVHCQIDLTTQKWIIPLLNGPGIYTWSDNSDLEEILGKDISWIIDEVDFESSKLIASAHHWESSRGGKRFEIIGNRVYLNSEENIPKLIKIWKDKLKSLGCTVGQEYKEN
jgi:hypothetical protein